VGAVLRYLGAVALVVVALFLVGIDVAVFAVGRLGGWELNEVAFFLLYAVLAVGTFASGVWLLHSALTRD